MKARSPRHGSMQFWPHRRANKEVPVVNAYPQTKDAAPLGFAGFKVGMTHAHIVDSYKNSPKKGESVMTATTIIECPPLKVIGLRTYIHENGIYRAASQIITKNLPKQFSSKLKSTKSSDLTSEDNVAYVRLLVMTQPSLTTIGRKKPDMFEIGIGGKASEQLAYAKEMLGKDITVADMYKPGDQVDIHAVTTGKGFSGAMKRFDIRSTSHKSEKGTRTAGSLGGWTAQAHVMYRVPSPGKHGYYTRTTHNQRVVAVGDKPEDVNAAGGFGGYGIVKNPYILIKGSVHGPNKRLIRITAPIRPNMKAKPLGELEEISVVSNQG